MALVLSLDVSQYLHPGIASNGCATVITKQDEVFEEEEEDRVV